MLRKHWLGLGAALLLGGTASAQAPYTRVGVRGIETSPTPQLIAVVPGTTIPVTQDAPAATAAPVQGGAVEGASRQGERAQEAGEPEAPKLGPTPPEDVKILMNTGLGQRLDAAGIRMFGWADVGYTYASSGSGLLPVMPRENRFGNELLANQLALVIEKPLKQDELSFGFNITYYAGADAALLQPKGGIDDPPDNPRFSHDFRQLYVAAHLPILTEGGMDVKAGRMGTIIGYESALAPYRPFYSNDYQWFYSEDGAWTGLLTNLHVSKQLDVLNGVTFGANTFFTKRSHDSICYIGQVNYWLQEEKKTLVSVGVQAGPDAIFAAPGLGGDFDTVVELRVHHNWNPYLTQIIQSNDGWDSNTPVGTGQWYSLYNIFVYHLSCTLDVNNRVEWFDDVNGTRTGVETNFWETTIGLDYHPKPWLSLRPEIRGDFAEDPVWHGGRDKSLLTIAMDAVIKF